MLVFHTQFFVFKFLSFFKILINSTNYTQKKLVRLEKLYRLDTGWILDTGGCGCRSDVRRDLLNGLLLRLLHSGRSGGGSGPGQFTGGGLLGGRLLVAAEDGLLDAQDGGLEGQRGEDGGGEGDAEVVPPAQDLQEEDEV